MSNLAKHIHDDNNALDYTLLVTITYQSGRSRRVSVTKSSIKKAIIAVTAVVASFCIVSGCTSLDNIV